MFEMKYKIPLMAKVYTENQAYWTPNVVNEYQIYVPEPVPRCGGQLRAFEIPALAGVVRIK